MVIVKGWKRDYVLSDKDAALYQQRIERSLVSDYSVDGRTLFKGQSLSHLTDVLRSGRFKIPGDYVGQVDLFEKLGFRVIKAQPKFSYKKGFRARCTVVTTTARMLKAEPVEEST